MHRKVTGEFLHDANYNVIMQLKITGSSFVDRVSIVLRIRYCIYVSHVSKYLLLCMFQSSNHIILLLGGTRY